MLGIYASGAKAKAKGPSFPAHWPAGVRQCVCYHHFCTKALLTKLSQSTPQLCSSGAHGPACDVCAYSLNVSHLVVTQASRLAVRCRERPLMRLVTACSPPHVVASEKPVKFPALYRLIPLYHEPMTTCSLPSRLSFCTLPTPLLPAV